MQESHVFLKNVISDQYWQRIAAVDTHLGFKCIFSSSNTFTSAEIAKISTISCQFCQPYKYKTVQESVILLFHSPWEHDGHIIIFWLYCACTKLTVLALTNRLLVCSLISAFDRKTRLIKPSEVAPW